MASADTFATNTPVSFRLPLFGAIARAWTGDRANVPLYAILVLALIWGTAVAVFGLPALYLPAVVASPLMLVMLVAISRS